MHTITLICTRHEAIGACNLNELYRIVERIKPEVIFEELPPSVFDNFYVNKTRSNLESDTINKYLENHEIKHILVDYEDIPKTINTENGAVHRIIERRSHTYRDLLDIHKIYCQQFGFKYLNNIDCENLHKALYLEMEEALKEFKMEKQMYIFSQWIEIMIHTRENVMLNNIQKYCAENEFERGLFFIGGGHRATIIEKIKKLENEPCIINWNYNDYSGLL